jgi:hypothetical protein
MADHGGVRIGVARGGSRSAGAIAAHSRAALDRPLSGAAELWVAVARDAALVLGAYQRGIGFPDALPLLRRASGGPEVAVGPGNVYVALSLRTPDALEPCAESRIVNRSVRPLLRALTKTAGLANYFGRDWVSVKHRPAAWVGFAHDGTSGRTLFEAFVSVKVPFTTPGRPSLRDKVPGTLEEIAGRPIDASTVADAIADAYLAGHEAEQEVLGAREDLETSLDDLRVDPPWAATSDEAIGTIGAGPDARGTFRIGGDLLVSRDALARLESRVAAAPDEEVGRIVDETLAGPRVAIEGVRSLASVRDVILKARRS